jgi:acyl carrier protein
MNQVTTDIRRFIVDNFLFGQAGELSNDTSFLEEGIIDSTGVLELVGFLESHFGIRLEDDEIVPANLDSLTRLNCFMERKLAAVPVEQK